MADKSLVRHGLDRGEFSNRPNLKWVHLDGYILQLPFAFLGKNISQQLIIQTKMGLLLNDLLKGVGVVIIFGPFFRFRLFLFHQNSLWVAGALFNPRREVRNPAGL